MTYILHISLISLRYPYISRGYNEITDRYNMMSAGYHEETGHFGDIEKKSYSLELETKWISFSS